VAQTSSIAIEVFLIAFLLCGRPSVDGLRSRTESLVDGLSPRKYTRTSGERDVLQISVGLVNEARMLASRRRALAAATTAVAAIAVALAVAGRSRDARADGPDGAVRALMRAAKDGDRARVLELLGPATRARLERDAALAREQGGDRALVAADLIEVEAPAARGALEVTRAGDRAEVVLLDADGARSAFAVVRVAGRWRVELPAPAAP
jgi:hypothetical protein